MQALKIATIVMGVMIVVGITVIGVTIARRLGGPAAGPTAPVALTLDEPSGSRIVGLAATQDRLAVQLQGGGPDRIVLVDPRSGARSGSISLAPGH